MTNITYRGTTRPPKHTYEQFKTVDEYFDWFQNNIEHKFDSPEYLCIFIVHNYAHTLLEILRLETNTPSKYDICIINHIIKTGVYHYLNMFIYKRMLKIYKTRKD